MALGYLRGAFESVVGNETNSPTLSTKKVFFPVQEFQPSMGAQPLTRDDELRNLDQPVAAVVNLYEPSWEMRNRAYPDALGFLLKLALGAPTTTNGNGVITDPDSTTIPTGAYRHVWTAPFGPTGANPMTAQFDVSYVDQSTYIKMKGASCSTISIESPEDDASVVSAQGPAAYADTQSDPSLTASYESLSIRPFSRGNLSLPTWLSGSGSHENVSVQIERRVESVRSLNAGSEWPDTIEYTNDPVSTLITGTLDQRQLDPDDLNALMDATGFAATVRWVSDTVIASSYPYKLYIAFTNAQYIEGDPEALGNKRRHGAQFQFRGTSADGTTAANTITLVNSTSSYA